MQHDEWLEIWLVSSGQLVTTPPHPVAAPAAASVNCRVAVIVVIIFGVIARVRGLMSQSLGRAQQVLVQVRVWSLCCVAPRRDVVHGARRNSHSAQSVWETVVEAFHPRLRFVNTTECLPRNNHNTAADSNLNSSSFFGEGSTSALMVAVWGNSASLTDFLVSYRRCGAQATTSPRCYGS